MNIKNVKKSFMAHKQNYDSKHFEKTKYGKKLRRFYNLHKGEKCFIVGNGPSLKSEDLQKIYENHIVTFGTNRIFKIFNETEWRPTYFASEDVIIIKNIQKEISRIPSKAKFIPINLKWYEDVNIENADYFYLDYSDISEKNKISLDISHSIKCRSTITMTCLQLAIYMGFSEIYLIGVDHSFAKMIDSDGNVVVDNSIRNHFTDQYDADIIDQGYQIDSTTQAYMDIERMSRKTKKFQVFNATRGGKLEVFERVNFDDILN